MEKSEETNLPIRPSEEQQAGAAPSKNALKKAAKEKEKAEKAAKRQQQEREEKEKAAASDTAKHLYGPLTESTPTPTTEFYGHLKELATCGEEEEVTVQARVYNARVQSAKLAFLVLREQEHTIQVVIAEGGAKGLSRQMVKWCGGVHTESYVRVTGVIKKPVEEVKSTSISHLELHVHSIYTVSEAEEQLPLQVKDCTKPPPTEEESEFDSQGNPNASLKTRLDHRIMSTRAPATNAIVQLTSEVLSLFTEYMYAHNFTQIQPSYLSGSATEGGSSVFQVGYFDRKAYLTQSPQFAKQMAIAGDLGPVFSIGPVFRAENSNTKRHLTEFTGLDFEMPIRTHYHEVLSFAESLILFIIRQLQTRPKPKYLTAIVRAAGYPDAGNFLLPPPPAPTTDPSSSSEEEKEKDEKAIRITFAEAKALLKEGNYPFPPDETPESDIDTAQEKALGDIVRAKYHTDFFSVDQYPMALRPFYTHPSTLSPHNPDDKASSPSSSSNIQLSNSYDFFLRGQEIMSGAQRIHSLPDLKRNMRAKGVDPDAAGFRDYCNAFRYGCPMHGGGGIGLNRVVQFFLGLGNIREATLFVRDPIRLGP